MAVTYTSSSMSWAEPTTDAALRTMLQGINAACDAIGFQRTSDTGQYDSTTITLAGLPSSSTSETVYEVRYLNDSLHGSLPVLAKISYQRVSSTLRTLVRFGIATNGAGAFVGASALLPFSSFSPSYLTLAITAAATSPIYGTSGTGYGGLFLNQNKYGFYIARGADGSGAASAVGYQVYCFDGTDVLTVDYRASTQTFTVFTEPNYTFIPGGRTASSDPGAGMDVYRHWAALPTPTVNPFAVSVHPGEHELGTTFTADPISGQDHTFMPIPHWAGADATFAGTSRTSGCLAVRWESP